jgi:hypothetical protein
MNILDYLEGHKFRKISDRIFLLQNSTHNNIRQSTIHILKPLAKDLHDQLDTYKIKNLIYYVSYGYEGDSYYNTKTISLKNMGYGKKNDPDTITMTLYAGCIETKDWTNYQYHDESGSHKGTTIDRVILRNTYETFNQNKINQHQDSKRKIERLHEPLIKKIDDRYGKLSDLIYKRSDKQKAPIYKDIKRSQKKDEVAIKKLERANDSYKQRFDNETYRFSKGYQPLMPIKKVDDDE